MFTCQPPRRSVSRRSLCFSNYSRPYNVTENRFCLNYNSFCWIVPFITSPRRPSRINGRRPPAIQSVYTINPFVQVLCSQTCLHCYSFNIKFLMFSSSQNCKFVLSNSSNHKCSFYKFSLRRNTFMFYIYDLCVIFIYLYIFYIFLYIEERIFYNQVMKIVIYII